MLQPIPGFEEEDDSGDAWPGPGMDIRRKTVKAPCPICGSKLRNRPIGDCPDKFHSYKRKKIVLRPAATEASQ